VIPILISVAGLWAVAVVTPGPNFLVVTRSALTASRGAAFRCVAGILAGTVLWGAAGFLGVGVLFAAAPWLFAVLKVAGGLYLLWLGVRLLVAAARRAPGPAAGPTANAGGAAVRRPALLGFVTVVANPKSGAFVASLFAALLPAAPTAGLGVAMTAVMVAVSALWYGAVAWSLGFGAPRRLYLRGRRAVEALAGVLFAGFGIRLLAGR